MGILDEAIRDHLELKRKGGTQESDLRRLEDEAFGPPGRPGEAAAGVAAPAEALEPLDSEGGPTRRSEEQAEAEVADEEGAPEGEAAPEREAAFHDFAAEEGLVTPRGDVAPAPPAEEETPPSLPTDEIAVDDTQPHDIETELGAPEERPEPPPAEEVQAEESDIDEDLELTLDDVDLEPSEEVAEGEIDQGEVQEAERDEPEDAGEDVLEETPDFLRETPEHDRLWFEQKPPKDFDFDE